MNKVFGQNGKEIQSKVLYHPGEFIKEELIDYREFSAKNIADNIGIVETYMLEIINGQKPITSKIANAIEARYNISAFTLLKMQKEYDEKHNAVHHRLEIHDQQHIITVDHIERENEDCSEIERSETMTGLSLAAIRKQVQIVLSKAGRHQLQAEVIATALIALKKDPSVTVEQALSIGLKEWIK